MHNSDDAYFSKYSQNSDYKFFLEDDNFQDFELDGKLNQFLDMSDLDETDEFFLDEI